MKRKKISGKNRFRAAVRHVIANMNWLEQINIGTIIGENIKQNLLIIKSKSAKSDYNLGLEKVILRKPANDRTDEEIDTLFRILGNYKGFRRYPEEVRRKLVAHTYFASYGPNRTLIRQGHRPTFMAVLLTGELAVYHRYVDPVFQKEVVERQINLMPGAMIGEASLTKNTGRQKTLVTSTNVELLMLHKDDYDAILKHTLKLQWDEIKRSLSVFPYFSAWDDAAVDDCCMMSDIKHYKEGEIVIGLSKNKHALSHFILNGKCTIRQKIMIERNRGSWKLSETQADENGAVNVQGVCMEICQLREGGCFGVGENLSMVTVITDTEMSILRIPFFILQRNNPAKIWTRLRMFLDFRIPNTEEVFQTFLEGRKWKEHTKRHRGGKRSREIGNTTSLHDVPLSLRTEEMSCDEYRKRNTRFTSLRNTMFPVQRERISSVEKDFSVTSG